MHRAARRAHTQQVIASLRRARGLPPRQRRFPPIQLLSVVIPVKNNPSGLRRVLDSISVARICSPVPVEIVVVDDGSSDGTASVVRQGEARVIRTSGLGRRRGPFPVNIGAVRNWGIKHANGDAIASLDADCQVEPDYFERIAEALDSHDLVAVRQFPRDPTLAKILYSRVADTAFRIRYHGAAEPSVAFRRQMCPSGVCFRPTGYAEIRGLARQAMVPVRDPHCRVHTDMAAWRHGLGLLLVGGGVVGVSWMLFGVPGIMLGTTGFLAGRAGHVFAGHLRVLPHHWIPGVAAAAYGAVTGSPALISAGIGLAISDLDDMLALRFLAPSDADLAPARRFWATD